MEEERRRREAQRTGNGYQKKGVERKSKDHGTGKEGIRTEVEHSVGL